MGYNGICSGKMNNNSNTSDHETSLASSFFSLPPKQFALLSSLLGILLVDNLDLDQQNQLGNFIVNVGQALLTAAAQGAAVQTKDPKDAHLRQQIEMLKKQIDAIEQELD